MLMFALHGGWDTQAGRCEETSVAKNLEQHGHWEVIYKGCVRDAVFVLQELRPPHEHAGRNRQEPCRHSTSQEAKPTRQEKAGAAAVIGQQSC